MISVEEAMMMGEGQNPPPGARDHGPVHYQTAVQPWDAMEAWMPPHQFCGFLRGNVIKYMARMDRKGAPLTDLRKARHYLDRLIELIEAHGYRA